MWGNQWKSGLGHLDRERAGRGRAARHARLDRAGVDRPQRDASTGDTYRPPPRTSRAGARVTLRVLYPPAALAANAPYARHVPDDVLAATIAREEAAAAKAERDRRDLEDTLHHPVGLDPRRPGDRDRARRAACKLRLRALRPRAHDGQRARVRARATGRPGAGARPLAARAEGDRRRRPARGDALRARAPRPLQDHGGDARGIVVRRPAPQGGRRRRPLARRREPRAERRREAGGGRSSTA